MRPELKSWLVEVSLACFQPPPRLDAFLPAFRVSSGCLNNKKYLLVKELDYNCTPFIRNLVSLLDHTWKTANFGQQQYPSSCLSSSFLSTDVVPLLYPACQVIMVASDWKFEPRTATGSPTQPFN